MSSPGKNGRQQRWSSNPILQIEAEQVHLLALCDRLEEIADNLPGNLFPISFETVARELRSKLPRLHRHMELALFPALKKRALPEDNIDELIAGFTHEHAMDDGYVLGVLEVLDRIAAGPLVSDGETENYEASGYLLRGFFEAMRRHLRWQRFIVLRLARQRLSDEDLIEVADQMSIETS